MADSDAPLSFSPAPEAPAGEDLIRTYRQVAGQMVRPVAVVTPRLPRVITRFKTRSSKASIAQPPSEMCPPPRPGPPLPAEWTSLGSPHGGQSSCFHFIRTIRRSRPHGFGQGGSGDGASGFQPLMRPNSRKRYGQEKVAGYRTVLMQSAGVPTEAANDTTEFTFLQHAATAEPRGR